MASVCGHESGYALRLFSTGGDQNNYSHKNGLLSFLLVKIAGYMVMLHYT